MTKNADIDKYGYSGYGIGFDRRSSFSFPSGRFGQNILIFGADMSSSAHINNKKKEKLVLGKGPTQGLELMLTAGKVYSINFTEKNKKLCLSLHCNGVNSYLFGNSTEIYKFKAKDSEIVANPLCFGNISKDWLVDNMKRTGLNGYVYDFSVDYDTVSVDDIKDIHKYLMKKKGQACNARPKIINVNSNNTVFYPFSIKTNKCGGNCNNINDPYVKICVPDTAKDLNVKVFNLMSKTNEARHVKCHKTCKCQYRLDAIVCNNKQRLFSSHEDKFRNECKELIDKGVYDKEYVWNPSNCECECDKSCDIGKYLDYEHCKYRKRLVDKLVDECNENINEEVSENKNKCNSCILDIVLFSIFFIINVGIDAYFVYYKYMNSNKETASRYDYVYQAKNY